jgi:glyceraldehyde-3-phosphate dehydrogenase (NADP+)
MDLRARLDEMWPAADTIPAAVALREPINQTEYLVGGEVRRWEGPTQDVLSPVCVRGKDGPTPVLLGHYPMLEEKQALEALDAAVRAYSKGRGLWPTLSVRERIEHLEGFVLRMRERRDEVVRLLMWEIGKTQADSVKEFDRTVEYIRDTVTAMKELDRAGSRFAIEQGIIGQIRRAPLGVVLCMGPYNYPLNETFTTLIPALLMGNTVIFKPAKFGVLLHRPLLEAFCDSFPPGVVNTVYGDGAKIIGPMMSSGKIDVLAFIGSSRVGDIIEKQHPQPHRLRSVLGLEAKNAAIILPDADLELTVKECVLGSLSYNGQRCTALKMIYVHRSIASAFLERFTQAVGALKPGMPWEEGVALTPLPEPGKAAWLAELVKDAEAKGARVINPDGGLVAGTYFHPALLYPVTPEMRVAQVEQFGPLVPITPFDDIETPVRAVVDSNYGQQVSLFGSEADILAHLIDPLVNQVCRVNINCQCQRGPDTFPFTGRKDSAEGTLSVSDALRAFSIRTLVAAKESELNRALLTRIVREHKSNFLSTDFIL